MTHAPGLIWSTAIIAAITRIAVRDRLAVRRGRRADVEYVRQLGKSALRPAAVEQMIEATDFALWELEV